jgi:hypothetical protein
MRTFLAIQQYAPNQGTLVEAAIRLLDFVRRAGWAADRPKRLAPNVVATAAYPVPTAVFTPQIQIGLCLRSEPRVRDYKASVAVIDRNIGSVEQTHSIIIKVHVFTFQTDGKRADNSDRWKIVVWLHAEWNGRPLGYPTEPRFDCTLDARARSVRRGLSHTDLKRPETHARLWKDCK